MRLPWLPIPSSSPRGRAALYMTLPIIFGLHGLAKAECGVRTPDYAAERTVTVAGKTVAMRVNVSGSNVREETDVGNGLRVTIRASSGRRVVVFDLQTRTGMVLPTPSNIGLPTRSIDEVAKDGRRIRVQQVESRGRWLETSRTTCRGDGVMLDQTFVSVDARGQELSGSVAQGNIRVDSQPASLFEVPPDITMTRPGPR